MWPVRRNISAPKSRNPYPATYWSSPRRNLPASIGQQSVRAASRNTASARSAGRRGSNGARAMSSVGDTRSPSGKGQERGRRPELGDRQQHARRERQRGGGGRTDGPLQHQDEHALSDAEAARGEQREKSGEVRGREHRHRLGEREPSLRQQPAGQAPERRAIPDPGGE